MKIDTNKLIGNTLNWAVAKADGWSNEGLEGIVRGDQYPEHNFTDSWALSGPIIDHQGIDLWCNVPTSIAEKNKGWEPSWRAGIHRCGIGTEPSYGTTAIIAALRCFVTYKLGPVIDLPKDLK